MFMRACPNNCLCSSLCGVVNIVVYTQRTVLCSTLAAQAKQRKLDGLTGFTHGASVGKSRYATVLTEREVSTLCTGDAETPERHTSPAVTVTCSATTLSATSVVASKAPRMQWCKRARPFILHASASRLQHSVVVQHNGESSRIVLAHTHPLNIRRPASLSCVAHV